MSSYTPAEEHTRLVTAAVEWYREFFGVTIAWLFQGGRVPGLEMVSDSDLRSFFENTSPQYWSELMQTNPQEAMSQLVQYSQAVDHTGGEESQVQ